MAASTVGVVQFAITDGDADGNLRAMARLLADAPPADLLLLPELCTTGYAWDSWPEAAASSTPRAVEQLRRLAAQRGTAIGASMVSREETSGALVNRFWFFAPDAEPVHYDKSHLFSPMREDAHLVAGRSRRTVRWNGWSAALSICFDLRFPEMYRRDALEGADLFLVVSEWPEQRSEALRTLARARAMENQAALVLCNRLGRGADGTGFGGGSMIVAADGTVVVDAGSAEGVCIGRLDSAEVHALRSRSSHLALRQPGVDFDEVG